MVTVPAKCGSNQNLHQYSKINAKEMHSLPFFKIQKTLRIYRSWLVQVLGKKILRLYFLFKNSF